MLSTRVIPVLLLRNKGLVKTVRFGKHKYIGDPINAVKIFNDKEVDELVFLDIDASKKGNKPDFELVSQIASECFMPLGYGGGISNIEDMARLFDIGVEKVILNTAALRDLDLVSRASATYGAQSIVVCIDTKRNIWGKMEVFSHSGVKHNQQEILQYVKNAESAGAGEIILQAVDRDGIMKGYDLSLIRQVSEQASIPVVACGGAGNLSDFKKAADAGASALAVGSLFVYHGPHQAVLINYPTQQELKQILA